MPKNKNGDHFCTPTSPPNCVLDICGVRLSHQAFILRTLAHSPHKPSYQPLVCCSVHLTTKVSFQIGRPLKIISIFSYPAMLTTLRETLVIGTFNIGLPTTDVGTDGALIYKLFGGFPYHPNCTYHPCFETNCPTESEFATCLAGIPDEEVEYESHPTWATMLLVPFLLNYL